MVRGPRTGARTAPQGKVSTLAQLVGLGVPIDVLQVEEDRNVGVEIAAMAPRSPVEAEPQVGQEPVDIAKANVCQMSIAKAGEPVAVG